ncbi:MAG: hypothetical protein ABI234_11760 [Ktedonobacteraceae bacterium]
MIQRTINSQLPEKTALPKRRKIFFHFIKTGKLIGALNRDRRIAIWRKIAFWVAIIALLALLFFPDFFEEAVLSVILPFVGTILGIPLDAGFDWTAFALVSVNLLRIFPNDLVGEHYQQIFHAALR